MRPFIDAGVTFRCWLQRYRGVLESLIWIPCIWGWSKGPTRWPTTPL